MGRVQLTGQLKGLLGATYYSWGSSVLLGFPMSKKLLVENSVKTLILIILLWIHLAQIMVFKSQAKYV